MKFMEKVWGGLFESDEYAEEQPRVEETEGKGKKTGNIVNLAATTQKQVKVMVVEPFSFDDAQHVADHLKNRKSVVVNFENTDKEIAKRMIDFISGTAYALGGNIQKVGNNIFLCAPSNVDISCSPRSDNGDAPFAPWTK